MTRNQGSVITISKFLFLCAVLLACFMLNATWWIIFPSFVISVFFALVTGETIESWINMGTVAMKLADEAARSEELKDDSQVQVAEGFARYLPPRQMFACAIAQRGEPIVMYRGMKMWSTKPLDQPKYTRSGLLCWKYRPLM